MEFAEAAGGGWIGRLSTGCSDVPTDRRAGLRAMVRGSTVWWCRREVDLDRRMRRGGVPGRGKSPCCRPVEPGSGMGRGVVAESPREYVDL